MEATVPPYDGTRPFTEWRKAVERIAPLLQGVRMLEKGLTVAKAHTLILLEVIASIKDGALARVEGMEEMKASHWLTKFSAITENNQNDDPNYISALLNALSGKFLEANKAAVQADVDSWAKQPRSHVYTNAEGAATTLGDSIIRKTVLDMLNPQYIGAIFSGNATIDTTVSVINALKALDLKAESLYMKPINVIPLTMTVDDFYNASSSTPTGTGETPNMAQSSIQTNAHHRTYKSVFCRYCEERGFSSSHSDANCWANPDSRAFRPHYNPKRRFKSSPASRSRHPGQLSRNARRVPRPSMFVSGEGSNSDSDEGYVQNNKDYSSDKYIGTNRSNTSIPQPTSIPISISGKEMPLLADTGADEPAIEESVAKQLLGKWRDLSKPITFKYAEGKGTVSQTFTTIVKFSSKTQSKTEKVTFYVFKNLSCKILLGKSFFKKAGAIINYITSSVTVFGVTIPMLDKPIFNDNYITSLAHDVPSIKFTWSPQIDDMVNRAKSSGKLSPLQCAQLGALLWKYRTVFREELYKSGQAKVDPVRLGLSPSYEPHWTRYNPTTNEAEKLLQTAVDRLVNLNQAEALPMSSTNKGFNSKIRLVDKGNGKMRTTINLIRVNNQTLKDTTPLPRVDTLTDDMAGFDTYWVVDFCSGFDQIPLHPDDRPATAFSTAKGRYQLTTLPQGATNSPGTFQRIVERVIAGINNTRNFIDDMIGGACSWKDSLLQLEQLLERCSQYNMVLKPSKCQFGLKEVEFLGFVLSKEGKRPGTEHTKAIAEMPAPTTSEEVHSFLGLTGYFRTFIKDYANLETPLLEAVKSFVWKEAQIIAFRKLKAAISIAPTLFKISPNVKLEIHSDASKKGLGATLVQRKMINGKEVEVPVAFWSKKLTKAQSNYSTIKRELAAMYHATKKFKRYIYMKKITIYTDHKPLIGLIRTNSDDLEHPEATWVLHLSSPFFDIKYKPGASNSDADAMSRLPVVNMLVDVGTWKQAQEADPRISEWIRNIQNGEEYRDSIYEDGILYKQMKNGKRTVVAPQTMIQTIMKEFHNGPLGGHFATAKTFAAISQHYSWPGMWSDIDNYCKSCLACIQKLKHRMAHGIPANLPFGKPWETICMDIVGPFKKTKLGNMYYILAIDTFTENIEVRAIPDTKSSTIKKFVVEQIIVNHGVPCTILNDNAKYFTSELMEALYRDFGIQMKLSTPYNPQGNGKAERANGTFNMLLNAASGGNIETTEWDLLIPAAVFAYRRTPHNSTGESPFYLEHLRDPRMPSETTLPGSSDKDLDTWKRLMKADLLQVHERAKLNIINAMATRNERLSASQPPTTMEEGDLVWYHQDQVQGSRKFFWPWKGPYRVTKKQNDNVYEISDLGGAFVIPKVNIRRLREFKQAWVEQQLYIPMFNNLQNPTNTETLPTTTSIPEFTKSIQVPLELQLEPTLIPRNVPVPSEAPSELFKALQTPNQKQLQNKTSTPNPPIKRSLSRPPYTSQQLEAIPFDLSATSSQNNQTSITPMPAQLTPSAPSKHVESVKDWIDTHNVSKRGISNDFRQYVSSYIKSADLAGEVQKVMRNASLEANDKREAMKSMLDNSNSEDWHDN